MADGAGSDEGRAPGDRWNHNLHYHPVILDAVPDGCDRALDVGCGEGMLSRELAQMAHHVTAIDLDPPSIELARTSGGGDIEYLLGDVLTYPFAPGSFDLVASVATLHHLGTEVGLTRMADLVRPGGTLAVVAIARSSYPRDAAHDLAGTV